MRFRLTNLLQDGKQQLFMANEPKLCEVCNQSISTFVNNMITKLDEMEQTMPLDELDPHAPEEFTDAE